MVNVMNMLWAVVAWIFGMVSSAIVLTVMNVFVSTEIVTGLNSILVQFGGWAFTIFMVFIMPIIVATDDDQKLIGGIKKMIIGD